MAHTAPMAAPGVAEDQESRTARCATALEEAAVEVDVVTSALAGAAGLRPEAAGDRPHPGRRDASWSR